VTNDMIRSKVKATRRRIGVTKLSKMYRARVTGGTILNLVKEGHRVWTVSE